jgi:uncharacterized protein
VATDFETAAREKLGIITVIMNNGAMGGYEKNIPIAVERYRSKYTTGGYTKMADSLAPTPRISLNPTRLPRPWSGPSKFQPPASQWCWK